LIALRHYEKIDIWCNNAGIGRFPEGFFENDEAIWKPIIDINLTAVIFGFLLLSVVVVVVVTFEFHFVSHS
jgi:NAD(P)-dependent dehydrogenase (short-subunit alcohol dehydrogenase family)